MTDVIQHSNLFVLLYPLPHSTATLAFFASDWLLLTSLIQLPCKKPLQNQAQESPRAVMLPSSQPPTLQTGPRGRGLPRDMVCGSSLRLSPRLSPASSPPPHPHTLRPVQGSFTLSRAGCSFSKELCVNPTCSLSLNTPLDLLLPSTPPQQSCSANRQATVAFASSFHTVPCKTGILLPPCKNPTFSYFAPSNFILIINVSHQHYTNQDLLIRSRLISTKSHSNFCSCFCTVSLNLITKF